MVEQQILTLDDLNDQARNTFMHYWHHRREMRRAKASKKDAIVGLAYLIFEEQRWDMLTPEAYDRLIEDGLI